ncbi:MAG TPA: hypothetical protein VGL56_15995 [Fimbriimonadaceae bacterium]|jgi:hypothetical protein
MRFAKILLDDNRHETVFDVDIGRECDVEAVTLALKELGCAVEPIDGTRLKVCCE